MWCSVAIFRSEDEKAQNRNTVGENLIHCTAATHGRSTFLITLESSNVLLVLHSEFLVSSRSRDVLSDSLVVDDGRLELSGADLVGEEDVQLGEREPGKSARS